MSQQEVQKLKADLEKARLHIEALEDYIIKMSSCVVCECSLLPPESAPRCESCGMDDEKESEWEDSNIKNPIAHFRELFR